MFSILNYRIKLIVFFSLIIFSCKKYIDKKKTINGYSLGTSYSIQYEGGINNDEKIKKEIDSLFEIINQSLSTYISDSDISKINRGDSLLVVDKHFKKVFNKSHQIWDISDGFFDPTVGSLVNAYGFGPEIKINNISKKQIDSLIELTGFLKVSMTLEGTIKKKFHNIYFDFNAIGKGYMVDVISELLDNYKIKNYLIEIGGEIIAKGINPNSGKYWKIAIDTPDQKKNRKFIKTILLKNKAIATSGNYRKYRIDSLSGIKYVHSINPKNGQSIQSNILSVSVIASDCMTADGWATALMIMPIEFSIPIIESFEDVDAYWILSDSLGYKEIFSSNWSEF